jgi:hypothetical protein
MGKLSALATETTFALSDFLVKIKAAGAGDVKLTLSDFLVAIGVGAWTSWTPTISSGITIGNGTFACKYQQVGKTVRCYFQVTFGSTTTMGAAGVTFTLPVTAAARTNYRTHLGNGLATGSSNEYPTILEMSSATTGVLYLSDNSTPYGTIAAFSSTLPFTWATGHVLSGSFEYEAA